ncbi:MAG: hypothetical protein Q8K45_10700 [Rubrivivax sp.]|nr:hypothetical protein [Rubrivivax sp.]
MNDKTHDPKHKLSARRRLIRGAFAAPAALTLYSGSVAARSINNCVTRQVGATPSSTTWPASSGIAGTTDTWVRVRLKKFTGKYGTTSLSNRYSRWIKGADVVALQAAGTNPPFLNSSQWQLYDRGVTNITKCDSTFNPASAYGVQATGTVLSTQPTEGGSVTCYGSTSTRTVTGYGPADDEWVALRVNAGGDIVGVVGINNTASTSPVFQSCWTSFRVG